MSGHMMSHSNFNFSRRIFAGCLLLTSAALPLQAWAADTDGDGVDDSIDAFPAMPEATIDTDGDGKPNSINTAKLVIVNGFSVSSPFSLGSSGGGGWTVVSPGVVRGTVSNAFINQNGKSLKLSINVPPAGAILSVNVSGSGATGYTHFTGQSGTTGMVYNYSPGQSYTEQRVLSPGSNGFSWYAYCSGNTCSATGHTLSGSIVANTSLIEDLDDDNDGVLDVNDPYPLDPTRPNADADGDGVVDSSDNCPAVFNADQLDTDGDAQGDACDIDLDNDGVVNNIDNCPFVFNADQLNTDNDYEGNECDADDDNDGVLDHIDAAPLDAFNTSEIILPVNSSYDGGSISEAQNLQ